jgi:hypothetical protein
VRRRASTPVARAVTGSITVGRARTGLATTPASRSRVALLLALALVLALFAPLSASEAAPAEAANRDRAVTVMSRNLYLGASLGPLTSGGDVLAAVRTVWQQVQDTDYPQRAQALADEIVEHQPLLVGLQEVTTYRTGPLLDPAPATDVEMDFLEILLDALAARGHPYRAIASVENFDGELPHVGATMAEMFDLRLTDRDVIIVPAGARTSELKVLSTDAGHFDAMLPLPIGGQEMPIVRGWVSADVKHRGQTIRFVNTHPEAFHPGVNAAQIGQLLSEPLATHLPVVLVGDLNATPGSASMAPVWAAGFEDAAVTAPGGDAGPTCCFSADVLGGSLTSRIDYVLYRGAFTPLSQQRVGHLTTDRTPDGLYPSDHAGVVAELVLPGVPGRTSR